MAHNILITEVTAADTWPLRHQVMWPDRDLAYVQLPDDQHGIHFGLFVYGELTSVISLFINGKTAQFRKFATDTSQQGKGYGSALLKHLITESHNKGIHQLWCNARQDKCAYYERFGFIQTNDVFNRGGIDYVIMINEMKNK
jgi:GNAT superfamily N-acetyltransferase